MQAQKKGGTAKTKKKKISSLLPQIPQEEADKARERSALRIFRPSATRPPSEFLPNPDFITILDQGAEGSTVGMSIAKCAELPPCREGQQNPSQFAHAL